MSLAYWPNSSLLAIQSRTHIVICLFSLLRMTTWRCSCCRRTWAVSKLFNLCCRPSCKYQFTSCSLLDWLFMMIMMATMIQYQFVHCQRQQHKHTIYLEKMDTRTFPDVMEAPGGSRTLPGVSQHAPCPSLSSPKMIFVEMMARMSTEVLNILKRQWTHTDHPDDEPDHHGSSWTLPDLPGPTHGALVWERLRGSGNDRNLLWPGH